MEESELLRSLRECFETGSFNKYGMFGNLHGIVCELDGLMCNIAVKFEPEEIPIAIHLMQTYVQKNMGPRISTLVMTVRKEMSGRPLRDEIENCHD